LPVITLYSGQVAGIPSISISGIWDLISGLDATTERFCPDQTGSLSVRKGNLVDLPMMDQFVQEEEYCEHIYNMIRYRCTPTHTHTPFESKTILFCIFNQSLQHLSNRLCFWCPRFFVSVLGRPSTRCNTRPL